MNKRLLSVLLCLCMLISMLPAISGFAAGCEHVYKAVVTPPTCAARGYTTYSCAKCGYTYIGSEVETLDHVFDQNGRCTECGLQAVTVRFACDEGVSVAVSETQDMTGQLEENAGIAYPRNAENGKFDFSGDGQVNFIVRLEPGYELESVTADDADAYKDLKRPFETGVIGGYRLTRVCADLTVTVRVKRPVDPSVFTVRFDCDPGVSVTTYEKQSRAGSFEENAERAIARNGATGEPDVSGSGQVNFLVVAAPGYHFVDIDLSPVNVFQTVRFPGSLGIENGFRITGITGNLTVRVSAMPDGPQECKHTYIPKITPPTCTEAGYTAYTCEKCGESYTANETAPTGHSFCDQGFCTACGMLACKVRFVCDPGVSVSVSRTRNAGARTDDSVCLAYPRDGETGEIVMDGSGQVIFTVHTDNGFRLEGVVPEPTDAFKAFERTGETSNGNGYCLSGITGDVSVTVKSSVIDPETCTHDYRAAEIPPTCISEGYTTYSCAICGDTFKADRKPRIAHSYQDGVCSVCGEKRISVSIVCDAGVSVTVNELQRADSGVQTVHPRNAVTGLEDGSGTGQVDFAVRVAEGYQLLNVSVAPSSAYRSLKGPADTASKNAYRVTGIRDDCTVTVNAVKLGCEHSFTAEVTAPTCTDPGFTTYTCTNCGYSYRADETPAPGHDYSVEVTAPTCTKKGNTTYTCTRCGYRLQAEEKAALGHEYRTEVTAPTCTEKGFTTFTCARCGYSRIGSETAATGHTYQTAVTVPTCTKDGYITHTCTRCGYSYDDSVTPASGHDYTATVTEPTCTHAGHTTYTCTVCGDAYTGDKLPALDHDFKITVTPPTCTEKGYTTYACRRCRYAYAVDETEALGHDYTAEVIAPTCTQRGYTAYTCTRCGEEHIGNETAALGHDYTAEVTAPTCTQGGHTTYTCTRCGEEHIGNETAALDHDYTAEVTAPTCTQGGYTVFTCTRCGDSVRDRETSALGHDWDDGVVTKQPLDTIPGVRTYTCTRCGETRTETIQPLSHIHSFVTEVIPPTCSGEGYTLHTCRCGDSYVDARVPALGHDSTAAITAPTCTEPGHTAYTCARCGAIYSGDEIPALGHDYRAVLTAPTCTERGYTTYICTRCGDSHRGDEIAALGHDYKAVVTAPTCTEPGCTTHTCAVCGDRYVGSEVPALGHAYRVEITPPTCTEAGYTTHTCARCGDSYRSNALAATGHDWGEGVVTRQPTETSPGERTFICAACGQERTEVIPELVHEHSYSTVTTPPTCTGKGYTTHTCTCGDCFTDGEVPALGHDYQDLVTAPTCTEAGYTTHTCTRCGDSYRSNALAATGHDWGEGVVTRQPTETLPGERTFICAGCGQERTEVIPELVHEHSYSTVTTPPTCTGKGYTTHTCTCGDCFTDGEVPALGHAYRVEITPPTCTEAGYTTHTCTRCGDRYAGEETAALGHDWDEGVIAREPGPTEPGERSYTCLRCGEKYTETIPELGHVHAYTAVVTAPTCTEAGYTTHTCSCGSSYTDGALPALGHDDRTETTFPTCTAAGYTVHTCTRCGSLRVSDETDALGHEWDGGTVTAEPTETEPGERVYRCVRCGEQRTEIIPERSHVHSYTEAVTAPTCTEAGFTTHTCSCGSSYTDSEVPALGHAYADGVCTRCGAKDPEDTQPFRFDDVQDDSQYFYEPVYWAVDREITNGATPTTFNSGAGCTRAQVVTFLWRAAGKPEPQRSTNPFADVRDGQYYTKAVLWAVEQEITNGTGSGKFSPGATCTRGQIVTFLWRYFDQTEPENEDNPFEDVKEGQYYTKAILWAVEDAITKGTSAEKFSPNATCTRGQIVTFLYRAMVEEAQ